MHIGFSGRLELCVRENISTDAAELGKHTYPCPTEIGAAPELRVFAVYANQCFHNLTHFCTHVPQRGGSNQTSVNKGSDMFGFSNEKVKRAIMELPGAPELKSAATKARPAASKDDKEQLRQEEKVRLSCHDCCAGLDAFCDHGFC